MNTRTIVTQDHEKLISFWQENYFVSEMDSFDRFKLFLEKNPKLSVLIEENGEIIGTALGSFDGRRGYLQKVVTKKSTRRHGIGKQLVEEVIKRLQSMGTLYIPIAVEKDLVGFYEKCGFKTGDQVAMKLQL